MGAYNNYGRFSVTRPDGRKFVVDPVINKDFIRKLWGDATPNSSGTWTGPVYGQKHPGGIPEEESTITPENGYINIVTLPPGESPHSWIDKQ